MRAPPAPINSLGDAFAAALLGLRDGVSFRLAAFSIGLWLGACALWTLLLVVAWSPIKAVASFITAWS